MACIEPYTSGADIQLVLAVNKPLTHAIAYARSARAFLHPKVEMIWLVWWRRRIAPSR